MDTAIIRAIISRSIMILSIFVLLSGCHHSSGSKSNANADDNANAEDLATLVLSSGTLTPGFNVDTTSYTAEVANGVLAVTATMTTANSTSTITVNGQAVSSGVSSQPINLSVGANTITIVVTAKDKTTTKTYTVVITRVAPAPAAIVTYNADLAGINLSTGSALSPAFTSGTTSYTAQVFNIYSSLTITPTVVDSTSTITVNGQAVSSGVASQPINLLVGANTITIVVTAKDGKTTKTYTAVITRVAPAAIVYNVDLAGISLSTGSALAPAFNSGTTSYTALVDKSSLTITPTVADSTSTITVNGQVVSSGVASQAINLSAGATAITIVVTAKDKTTTKTYTVVITSISHNAFLVGLSLPKGSFLSPAFTYSTTSYTGLFPDNILSTTITPTAAVSTSTITVNGQAVSSGVASNPIDISSPIIIVVKANDGTTTMTYSVGILKVRPFLCVLGDNTINKPGIYDDPVPANNKPGARWGSVSWTDNSGDLWLFGGYGYDSTGNSGDLNDLWKFDVGDSTWSWVSGTSVVNQNGISDPTKGTVQPGGRDSSVSWKDSSGNLWLFGGYGYDSAGNLGDLNDLWKFDVGHSTWSWISGSNTVNQYGVYNDPANNKPGAREGSVSWIDSSGNLWLFGGHGYDSTGNSGDLNDLWKFDVAHSTWSWVSGTSVVNQNGNSDPTKGTVRPGGRASSVSWIDSSGTLWLFGGRISDSAGIIRGCFNDLWKFNVGTSTWSLVSGNQTINNIGVYSNPVPANNKPGARWGSISWIDSSGTLWLFGGSGYDGVLNENGYLNDLWKFDVGTSTWSWVYGSNIVNQYGVYGGATSTNIPGGRASCISWIDSNKTTLWFFGGLGYDSAGNLGDLNDLWKYK